MAKTLRRPTKEMMLAVNASIAKDRKKVNALVKEHKLSRRQLEARLEIRDGEKYDLRKKGGRPKASGTKNTGRATGQQANDGARGRPEDLLSVIDGRTRTVTLLRIAYKASELLEAKPKAEVRGVEKAMDEAHDLKRRYEEAMALIGDEPPI